MLVVSHTCSYSFAVCALAARPAATADKTPRIAERVAAQLQLNRFVVSKVETADLQPAPAVCLLAHPSQ
ncbi:MAG: hypothetical protein HGA45_22590 [Chloroflexales bacterium]|nr:hypothetical protein [Chloroflexales bacterium]